MSASTSKRWLCAVIAHVEFVRVLHYRSIRKYKELLDPSMKNRTFITFPDRVVLNKVRKFKNGLGVDMKTQKCQHLSRHIRVYCSYINGMIHNSTHCAFYVCCKREIICSCAFSLALPP